VTSSLMPTRPSAWLGTGTPPRRARSSPTATPRSVLLSRYCPK
jgi:hypothetical protein